MFVGARPYLIVVLVPLWVMYVCMLLRASSTRLICIKQSTAHAQSRRIRLYSKPKRRQGQQVILISDATTSQLPLQQLRKTKQETAQVITYHKCPSHGYVLTASKSCVRIIIVLQEFKLSSLDLKNLGTPQQSYI